jgi:Domain of unknown function (DUF4301)
LRHARCFTELRLGRERATIWAVTASRQASSTLFTDSDRAAIQSSGRDPSTVVSQVEVLMGKRHLVPMVRPASLGDGVLSLDAQDRDALGRAHDEAAAAGRVSSFVPASGSGTRMFQSLLQLSLEGETSLDAIRKRGLAGDKVANDALVVLENVRAFALWPDMMRRGCAPESNDRVLPTLFAENGPRYHDLPKGLVPYHRYGDADRTAFIEHVYEAVPLVKDARGDCRLHFTVSPSHVERFASAWRAAKAEVERTLDARVRILFSTQSPATDAIAVDLQGHLYRDGRGQIVFRPGGHGALLDNLAKLDGDIVLVKNIDNIARQERSRDIIPIRRLLSGLLVIVEREVHEAIQRLRDGEDADAALRLLRARFGITAGEELNRGDLRTAYAMTELNRPLRVCGVIKTGEHTGGRAFWVDVPGRGPALQIVESAEIDTSDARSKALFDSAPFFNPVDIVCSLRDLDGKPYDLRQFTSPERAIVASKSLGGVPSLVYEHPGLWNGGMGLWNTVFIEVPGFTFNPVKSLADLWTEGHRMQG